MSIEYKKVEIQNQLAQEIQNIAIEYVTVMNEYKQGGCKYYAEKLTELGYVNISYVLELCDMIENEILNEKIDNNTKFHMRAGLNMLRGKL